MVEDSEKIGLLQSLVAGKEYVQSVLVFASKKMEVKDIERKLVRESIMARAIHSDLEQSQREQVLRDFRNRKFQVLVATDIVARGIDIEDIDLVVNYNVPADPEDYVHRIGRTARAQSDGVAITFVNKKERPQLARIEKFLGETIFRVSHS